MMQTSVSFDSRKAFVIFVIIFFFGCGDPRLPEGQLVCESDRDCPEGWLCSQGGDNFCYSSESEIPVLYDTDLGLDSDTYGNPDSDTGIETDVEKGTESEAELDAGEDEDGGGGVDAGADTEAGSDSDLNNDTDTSPAVDSETDTGLDSCQQQAVIYDFEIQPDDFEVNALDSTIQTAWEWGTPTIPEGRKCHSGKSCFITRLDDDYDACTSAELVSPAIDLSHCADSERSVFLRFWHYYDFSADTGEDGGALLFSPDNGKSWQHVAPTDSTRIDGAYGGKKCNNIVPELQGQKAWTGLVPGRTWTEVLVELDSAFKTPKFRFRFLFSSDRNDNSEGWLIDDAEIVIE